MPDQAQVHYNQQLLEDEIQRLGREQAVTLKAKPLQAIEPLLSSSKKTLTTTYRALARAARKNRELSVAGEWLIDNFYIIQEQIVQLKEDLPISYYRKLPRLESGPFTGYSRIYEVVHKLAVLSDNIIDRENTKTVVKAFQHIEPLRIGELWAVPIMIRLMLILRLAERSEELIKIRQTKIRATNLVDKMLEGDTDEPGYLLRKLGSLPKSDLEDNDFLLALARRLQNTGMLTEMERSWFDYRYRKQDTTLEKQMRTEAQETSRLHLSIQNAISSLREVSEADWSDFVEETSVMERILRLDPSGHYAQMDFKTRDTYRKIIEKLSLHTNLSEQEVAEKALVLAENESKIKGEENHIQSHIGYYLMDEGYQQLKTKVGYRERFGEWIFHWFERHSVGYFFVIFLHFIVLMGIAALATGFLEAPLWLTIITLLAAFLPALDMSVVSTHRILTLLLPPRILPKLEIEGPVPDEYRTLVVVPTLFTSPDDVRKQLESLEIRALANPNKGLKYAMLSDFTDAPEEHMPDDEEIINTAKQEIQNLNERYKEDSENRFFLLHRRRLWNEKENVWMGWERKRGKLEELNRLLIDPKAESTYEHVEGGFWESIKDIPVRYVLTLDADTKMPPGGAIDLIRTAAHPLNSPRLTESGNRVAKGYGIFQPRISIPPQSANKSWFARIYSGNVGLDPYTTAVSDVYQDMFGEGVFTGKGLYNVELFEKLLGGHFPENMVLSHDLLESTYLRSALLTDIEFFDDYPTTYISYSKRNHRWVRGDWQILQWLLPKVPSSDGEGKGHNPINIISRWKIFDNLRRSLNPAALLIFLLLGWTILPGPALAWTAAVVGIMAFPIYSSFSTEILNRPRRVAWKLYLKKIRDNLKINTIQSVTTLVFMPHQAYIQLDAVFRTLWRITVSKENLLEWTSALHTERQVGGGLATYYRTMWINLFWAVVVIVGGWFFKPSILFLAVPFGLAWIAAPLVGWYISRDFKPSKKELSDEEETELRGYARRTWQYFERYTTAEHSWLPPDNFQEEPYIGAVGRTSPTNMGLALTAAISAYELGYLNITTLLDRLGNSLGSMKLLETYNGHFFNWYSTKLGEILNPRYISTVDSGNLAASLLVVKQMMEELKKREWPNNAFWSGLADTVFVLHQLTEEYCRGETESKTYKAITEILDLFDKKLGRPLPVGLEQWETMLTDLAEHAKNLREIDLDILSDRIKDVEFEEIRDWFDQPLLQIERQLYEIREVSKAMTARKKIFASNPYPALGDLAQREPFAKWLQRAEELAGWCGGMVREMDFSILYNKKRGLFSIGYNMDRASADKGTYDLLSSEARLASYLAIAKGEVPPEHWFRLGRRLTSIERNEILLSWGGTMFEYLMPLLFMSRYEGTLLSQTYDYVVEWQEEYGSSRSNPWGVSESAYGLLNLEMHYQYRAFGAPGLGLRRGLAEDYVVAPYASMLALMVRPRAAFKNLKQIKKEGGYGLNGFYEAIDYTPSRIEKGEDNIIVKMYMAHHQGMGLLAMTNVLKNNLIQHLFHNDPLVQSCELLLQERIPKGVPIKEPRPIDVELEPGEEQKLESVVDHSDQQALNDSTPRTHILSNGRHSTVITHAGTGYSSHDDITLTRWRADRVQDPYGFFFYIKDLQNGEYWSMGHQPVQRKADRYDSWFHDGKVQTARVDDWIESFMEVCVSSDDDIELRKITLTNYSDRVRRLEVTSYAEIVLNTQEADAAHPAFSNLFVQTDHIPEHHALIARRRPRAKEEKESWLVHTMASDDINNLPEPLEYETDRGKFIGRGRTLKEPAALDIDHDLSGSTGNVPDPIVSMRRIIELKPGQKKSVTYGLGKVNSREEAVTMADRYDNPYATDRVFELASIYGRVELEHIGLSGQQAHTLQKLAGALLYGEPALRTHGSVIQKNRKTQSGLWTYGISGDYPILLYSIEDTDYLKYIDLLLKAHALWRLKRFKVDLVIINDHPPSYADELHQTIHQMIQSSTERQWLNERGGLFVLRGDDLSPQDRILLETVASCVLSGKIKKFSFKGDWQDIDAYQFKHQYRPIDLKGQEEQPQMRADLKFYNGFGGFTQDGNEYVITLKTSEDTGRLEYPPAPWINVIANPEFGFITSEKGSDYSWSQNSRENRLTPWSNDAVVDPPGEVIYVRDEEQRLYWTPTPGPVAGSHQYEVRHGFGYSVTQSRIMNIEQEVTKWVPLNDPLKIVKLRLHNTDLSTRHLSLIRYNDWVLGVQREKSTRHILTNIDPELQSVFAQNHYNNEFAGRIAFTTQFTEQSTEDSYTANREAFIGRNRSLNNPVGVIYNELLDGESGAGIDSCGAMQSSFFMESGSTLDIYYLVGEAISEEKARELIEKYCDPEVLESSLREVREFWQQKLGRIRVQTPLPELDLLANGWLQYQNIACRMWARSGFYQSGGAYGFRDQLQDAGAALYLDPQMTREQILLHAAHQFPEGDVLHWWHPPTDRGIRSRITDDLLWLPYITALYVRRTGDYSILDEKVGFLTARKLNEGEDEAYLTPKDAGTEDTLYNHCCRAIDRSLTKGKNGLPLIGTGDWNDGMNRVGEQGQGESVWLGFFLYRILADFIPIVKKKKESERVDRYSAYQKELKVHLNTDGWDGEWYRRAFYDDGTPLGSSTNDECKIDAIAQAWSVISKAAPSSQAKKALDSAYQMLVSEHEGIIRLLTPSFDKTEKDPGYIKGYIPGVRENGGQYTHGALWLISAFAELDRGERAVELLRMLSPVQHAATYDLVMRYKVEPYAVAADIYGEPPLTGMGGWTWYTGSAGWMYRVFVESVLGVRITEGNKVTIEPHISSKWSEYTVRIRELEGDSIYVIKVCNKNGLSSGKITGVIDGVSHENEKGSFTFRMKKDGKTHHVEAAIGPRS
ncbi:glycosyltransferase 36 [Aliifodinibius sp. S!AR15-10]|uniref:GH36-type glycosyl hydrolase domain-containing protein n=1 Tax=Aliifodinibius sp. S!AR15-10 TaxID=2950437 RepID=UPI0028584B31|nr:glucoamylase family protein [Aliifodinibius sp. S!AR15-10]MDR8393270.1 glycosyltransferase 36 [Aliifodinibius sp. S!AR15-10]